MSEQKHKIKRQIIELHVPQKSLDARQMQAEMSRIYRRSIVPIIDQYCTEFSSPDRIHRIDSLEIDLGQIDPANFEAEIVAKFRSAIKKALTTQINQQEQTEKSPKESPKTQSQLELLAQFARTGTIPWWADAAQPHLLPDCLHYLLTTTPHDLRYLTKQFVREERPFRRLITFYKNPELIALVHLFQSAPNQMAEAFVLLWQQPRFAANKLMIWQAIFEVAIANQEHTTPAEEFYTAVLQRIAPKMHTNYTHLLADIYQQTQNNPKAAELNTIIAILIQKNQTTGQHPTKEKTASSLRQTLAALQSSRIDPPALWSIIQAEIPNLPAHLHPQLQANLELILQEQTQSPLSADERAHAYFIQRIFALLQLTPEKLHKLASAAAELSVDQIDQLIKMASPTTTDKQSGKSDEQEPTHPLKFTDPNELYIANAGLVILWPFLTHFFTRLDMLQDKQFKDTQTQQKAIGLLQYIATAESDFPEYLLPLNKILCGADLFAVFAMEAPITDVEIAEGSNLLTAVITQAPILRNMSTAGFRSTFLLREGVLRRRDGVWLLQVEHLTHDIVLDRFPWSWQWVKLPWMDTALRVEW